MGVLAKFSLRGKRAVVTGGAGALGSVLGRALGEAGAAVWTADVDADRAGRLVEEMRGDGISASTVCVDVLDRDGLERAQETIGAVDILVNAAGAMCPRPRPRRRCRSSTCRWRACRKLLR